MVDTNRRNVLKSLTAATGVYTVSAGTGAAADNPDGIAADNRDNGGVDVKKSKASKEAARKAIQTPHAERLISSLSLGEFGIKEELSSARKIEGQIDQTVVVKTILVPFKAGKLFIHYENKDPFKAIVRLEEEELQEKFDWTVANSGVVYGYVDGGDDPVIGSRSITDNDIINQTEDSVNSVQTIAEFTGLNTSVTTYKEKVGKTDKSSSNVQIISEDNIYVGEIDGDTKNIENLDKISKAPVGTESNCADELVSCAIALITAAPTCGLIASACAGTTVGSVPCAIAVINTCLPSIGINLPSCTGIGTCL